MKKTGIDFATMVEGSSNAEFYITTSVATLRAGLANFPEEADTEDGSLLRFEFANDVYVNIKVDNNIPYGVVAVVGDGVGISGIEQRGNTLLN